jgi:hypothetical protein
MHFFDNEPPRKQEALPQKEAPPQLLDGTTRVLIVLLGLAVLGYFALPYPARDDADTGRQRQNIYGGIEPADVFGLRPSGRGDTEARSRLRLPEGVGNGMAPERFRGWDGRDESRRWTDCRPDQNGRFRCGPWQDGAPPRGGGRW